MESRRVKTVKNTNKSSKTTKKNKVEETKKVFTHKPKEISEQPIEFLNENRNFSNSKYKLYPDLVPKTAWYTNVRSVVSKSSWDKIRNFVYSRANNSCEICGKMRSESPHNRLDCHERWSYSDDGIQKLERLISMCVPCHMATHIGYWSTLSEDNYKKSIEWLCAVNGINTKEAKKLVEEAFEVWEERSKRNWNLDLSMLQKNLLII